MGEGFLLATWCTCTTEATLPKPQSFELSCSFLLHCDGAHLLRSFVSSECNLFLVPFTISLQVAVLWSRREDPVTRTLVTISDVCKFRGMKQTLTRVLSNCPFVLSIREMTRPNEVTFRYNSILRLLESELRLVLPQHFTILSNLPACRYDTCSINLAISEQRPKMIIIDIQKHTVYITELISPIWHGMKRNTPITLTCAQG